MPYSRADWKKKRDGILNGHALITPGRGLETVPFYSKPRIGLGPALDTHMKKNSADSKAKVEEAISKWKEFIQSEISAYEPPKTKKADLSGALGGRSNVKVIRFDSPQFGISKTFHDFHGNKQNSGDVCRAAGQQLLAALDGIPAAL